MLGRMGLSTPWAGWGGVVFSLAALLLGALPASALDHVVVDTGQDACYDDSVEITCPPPGEPFHGQDAQHHGNQPGYTSSGDALTVDDDVTGLTWQQSPDLDGDGDIDADDKLIWSAALAYPAPSMPRASAATRTGDCRRSRSSTRSSTSPG